MFRRIANWLFICICFATTNGHAAEPNIAYRPTSLASHVHLQMSGKPDDPIWKTVPLHDAFWMLEPNDGESVTERTTVQIVHDDKAIYFGIRANDKNPSGIRAPFGQT